jgi:hypothetical protein
MGAGEIERWHSAENCIRKSRAESMTDKSFRISGNGYTRNAGLGGKSAIEASIENAPVGRCKLESTKEPIDVIVIDSVEPPTPN